MNWRTILMPALAGILTAAFVFVFSGINARDSANQVIENAIKSTENQFLLSESDSALVGSAKPPIKLGADKEASYSVEEAVDTQLPMNDSESIELNLAKSRAVLERELENVKNDFTQKYGDLRDPGREKFLELISDDHSLHRSDSINFTISSESFTRGLHLKILSLPEEVESSERLRVIVQQILTRLDNIEIEAVYCTEDLCELHIVSTFSKSELESGVISWAPFDACAKIPLSEYVQCQTPMQITKVSEDRKILSEISWIQLRKHQ